jgi:hypothetical protein
MYLDVSAVRAVWAFVVALCGCSSAAVTSSPAQFPLSCCRRLQFLLGLALGASSRPGSCSITEAGPMS